jgi:hypothetical protein
LLTTGAGPANEEMNLSARAAAWARLDSIRQELPDGAWKSRRLSPTRYPARTRVSLPPDGARTSSRGVSTGALPRRRWSAADAALAGRVLRLASRRPSDPERSKGTSAARLPPSGRSVRWNVDGFDGPFVVTAVCIRQVRSRYARCIARGRDAPFLGLEEARAESPSGMRAGVREKYSGYVASHFAPWGQPPVGQREWTRPASCRASQLPGARRGVTKAPGGASFVLGRRARIQ